MRRNSIRLLPAVFLAAVSPPAPAQSPPPPLPPKAQAWIDVATFSGFGAGAPGGGNPLSMLGSLMGAGSEARNTFGQTQTLSAGRWVDATLRFAAQPQLAEAQWSVPAGFMSPALRMQSPREARVLPEPEREPEELPREVERPRGRMLLYWGCDAKVRQGQPRVLDFASADLQELQRFFVSRSATGRGAHASPGRPLWPSRDDARMVPAQASLVGEHAFSAPGVPGNFRFTLPAAQDLMPALALRQQPSPVGATDLSWNALPTARAYFAAAMGANAKEEMVLWTSSEVPETGMALADYQTNAAVDRWLREKVLMAPQVTRCTVPSGIFPAEGGGMLRLVAYGSELNLVHPPRPTDPQVRWEPDWAVKVRVKSLATAMLGMHDPAAEAGGTEGKEASGQGTPEKADKAPKQDRQEKPRALDLLRGILGR